MSWRASSKLTSPLSQDAPQQVHREGAGNASQEHPTTSPPFWHPCRGQVVLLFPFPDPNLLGCGGTVSWRARPWGCSPTALCHGDPPSDTDPTPILTPQQPARGRTPQTPSFPRQGSALPAAGVPQNPAEPHEARLVGCHPAARPRRVPRAGRQAMPQAALTGRFVLCGHGCPAGRQKGQSDAGEHCAGSHALRQQPAPPRSPRDPRRPGLCPPWCPRACSARPTGAPHEKGAVGLVAVVTAGPRPPQGHGRRPGCGVVVCGSAVWSAGARRGCGDVSARAAPVLTSGLPRP